MKGFRKAFAVTVLLAVLSADGARVGDYAVILTPDKGPLKGYAVELRDRLSTVSGKEVVFGYEGELDWKGPAIYVGDSAKAAAAGVASKDLKPHEFAVKSVGEDVIVNGKGCNDRIYAVYEFLEKACACRWYDQFNVIVPKNPSLEIGGLDIRRAPTFLFRWIHDAEGLHDPQDFMRWTKRSESFAVANKDSDIPGLMSMFGSPRPHHSFWGYQGKSWNTEHVDWLAMDENGKRRPLLDGLGPCMCMTNPEVLEHFKRKFVEFVEGDRRLAAERGWDAPVVYDLSPNDACGHLCLCPRCKKVIDERGESALLLDFVNAIADLAAERYPDIIINTPAYEFYQPVPKDGTRPRDNVEILVASTHANFYSAAEDDTAVSRASLREWHARSKHLACWEYWTFFWDGHPSAYHNLNLIARDFRYFRKLGVKVMKIQAEDPRTALFYSLKKWLGYKLLDNLDQDENALIDDFMRGFYGAAAPEMRQLMEYVARLQEGKSGVIFVKKADQWKPPQRPWLDADFFAKSEKIFSRALGKKLSEREEINVRRERFACDLHLLHQYDEIRPDMDRVRLADRTLEDESMFVKSRWEGAELVNNLTRARNRRNQFVYGAEAKAAKKSLRPPKMEVPVWPAKATFTAWRDNSGFIDPEARLKMEVSHQDWGGRLIVDFTDEACPPGTVREYRKDDTGDTWQIRLRSPQDAGHMLFAVAPDGKWELYHLKNSSTWIPLHETMKGVVTKNSFDGKIWKCHVELPLKDFPIAGLTCANFFRSGGNRLFAWSPTFSHVIDYAQKYGELKYVK